ncbi:hypothetical protein AU255_03860 [Methyloprofundus sedimenti]|uniref:Glycosyl transferase n=1 Tax=Methyloprofundus sedimenti TaxID=1420851 RepID=A0A1V8M6M4_9GAMM|nr:glycosyltransferase [Methyloprofundus sedimenti]OQK17043.1 hypothetical protein AU255_03860 [Methyloprofundus sedimenti]
MIANEFGVISLAALFSVPLVVIGFELLLALLHKESIDELDDNIGINSAYTILMPAHNEASIIAITLGKLLKQKALAKSIVVVADNCTDKTAEIAQRLGVTVLERFNNKQKGKGFALDYGLNYLKTTQPPEVLIILDADCEIDSHSLKYLFKKCIQQSTPFQSLYLMRQGRNASLKQRVAGFAWLVKNKLRPIAVNKLGLAVTLTGTGMAFPWSVIADINIAHGNIVEDMQLGIDCTLKGFAPVFCEQAIVYSDFPEQSEAETTQRTRWEHGHLMTITQQVPKLMKQALIRRDWRLLGLALDIGVPPLALLVMLSLFGLVFFAGMAHFMGHYAAFFMFSSSFIFFSSMIMLTWWRYGRDYLTLQELCSIPVYIVSKLSIYVSFIFKRQKTWVRTSRGANDKRK